MAATVQIVPGINAVNVGGEGFDPCSSGTPAAGQDHFEHVQPDGSFQEICLDKVASLMSKAGAETPRQWWHLLNEKSLWTLPQVLTDPTLSLEKRLDVAIGVVNKYQDPYPSDRSFFNEDTVIAITKFAEPLLDDPTLKLKAAQVVSTFARVSDVVRLQDRLAAILVESRDPILQKQFATALLQKNDPASITPATQNALFARLGEQCPGLPPEMATLRVPYLSDYSVVWSPIRGRIASYQKEHPIVCVGGLVGASGGGCSDPQFPATPWRSMFAVTIRLPVARLTDDQKRIQLQAIREMVIRNGEFHYRNISDDLLRSIWERYIALDRNEAISFYDGLSVKPPAVVDTLSAVRGNK